MSRVSYVHRPENVTIVTHSKKTAPGSLYGDGRADRIEPVSAFNGRSPVVTSGLLFVGKRPGKPFLPGSVVLGPVNSGLWAFSGEVSDERTGAGFA